MKSVCAALEWSPRGKLAEFYSDRLVQLIQISYLHVLKTHSQKEHFLGNQESSEIPVLRTSGANVGPYVATFLNP